MVLGSRTYTYPTHTYTPKVGFRVILVGQSVYWMCVTRVLVGVEVILVGQSVYWMCISWISLHWPCTHMTTTISLTAFQGLNQLIWTWTSISPITDPLVDGVLHFLGLAFIELNHKHTLVGWILILILLPFVELNHQPPTLRVVALVLHIILLPFVELNQLM